MINKLPTPLPILDRGLYLTSHAKEQMCRRRISVAEICAAVDYGSILHLRNALTYVVNRRGAEACRDAHVDRPWELEGLHWSCPQF